MKGMAKRCEHTIIPHTDKSKIMKNCNNCLSLIVDELNLLLGTVQRIIIGSMFLCTKKMDHCAQLYFGGIWWHNRHALRLIIFWVPPNQFVWNFGNRDGNFDLFQHWQLYIFNFFCSSYSIRNLTYLLTFVFLGSLWFESMANGASLW